MCGIFAICHCSKNGLRPPKFSLAVAEERSKRQKHRGPDYHGSYQNEVTGDLLVHERLAIMDLSCKHPFQGTKKDHQVIHNGEIYNHKHLRQTILNKYDFKTTCDSEVIIFLYEKERSGMMCNILDGIFTFALIFEEEFLVARDPIGVKPLFYGVCEEGRYYFSSEMKVIEDICGEHELKAFPPGHFWTPKTDFIRYYEPLWFNHLNATKDMNLKDIRNQLISATVKRLMSDAPLGILLSGGLDSSIVGSIAVKEVHRRGRQLKSFSIGLNENSPDLIAARQVADFLKTEHYEFYFTLEEGLSAIGKIIWHLESYDITTIRASTPMYLLSEKISKLGVKVVLSGEGADEIFGGYLYFCNAPNDEEFQKETIRRVQLLSTADCLRADKSCLAHGLEVRVPFLDKAFLDVALLTKPTFKRARMHNGRKLEKWLLRAAFDDQKEPYLPEAILWRQKEQFSDGVGYEWIDTLIEFCGKQVTVEEMEQAKLLFPYNTPTTKEAFYMRKIFQKHFPTDNAAKTVQKWIPKWQANEDPSGRASNFHVNSFLDKASIPPTTYDDMIKTS